MCMCAYAHTQMHVHAHVYTIRPKGGGIERVASLFLHDLHDGVQRAKAGGGRGRQA